MKKILLAVFAVAFIASSALYAEETKPTVETTPAVTQTETVVVPDAKVEETYPNIKLHGQTFTGFTYTRNGGMNFSSFNITRAFFGAYGHVSENWKYGVTMDIAPLFNLVNNTVTLSNGAPATAAITNAASVHLVMAYMAYKYKNHKFALGMLPTVWECWAVKNAWGHDRIAWSPLGVNGFLTNSRWDLGISAWGKPFKMLEYQIGFYNGEGYTQLTEPSNHKNLQARFTLTPLGDWMGFSTGMQWEKTSNNQFNTFVLPVIINFDISEMFKTAIYYTYMRADGGNAQMLAYTLDAFFMDGKVNPFFRIDYGLQNATAANGPTLAKKDYNIYAGIGYIFNKFVAMDFAFVMMNAQAMAAPKSYTFGPFAEIKFN